MARRPPPIGMFGIKLVGEAHTAFRFFGRAGRPALMNFPDSPPGRRIAADIPIGHRSLVYVMHPIRRFWTAIEYIKWDPTINDVLTEGWQAAAAQGADAMMEAFNSHYAKLWRCIRILALMKDPQLAPTPDFGFQEGDIMREISEGEYFDMFNAIPWTWTDQDHSRGP